MKTPEDVAVSLGLSPGVIPSRLAAIGLTGADRSSLRAAAPIALANAGTFLDALYGRLLELDETAALIADERQIERLKAQQRRYLGDLFSSEIDWDYVLRRLWIGVVHHRVRLAPQWYLTTYSHFICEHLDPIRAAAPTPAVAREQILALVKSVFFDASLVLDSYGHSEEAALWSTAQDLRPAMHDESAPLSDMRPPGEAGAAGPSRAYSRIRLTSENTLERRRFIGLTDMDITRLRSLRGLVERKTPEILDDFYAFLSAVPEMNALVPPETADRLKQQVASYWLELVNGTFDRPHAASRMRIGVMHEKIGVGGQWYLAGLAREVVGFLRAMLEASPDDLDSVRALVRAVFFDLSFVIDAYMEARANTLLRTEGYANQLVAGLSSAVAVIDGRDRIVSANRTMLTLLGGDPAVLFLMPVDSAFPVAEVPALVKAVRADRAQRPVALGRLGTRRLRVTAMALAGEAASDGTVALVVDDLTELLRLGATIDEQADQFEQLADTVQAVLWELDPASWTITAINRAAIDLTGFRDLYFLGSPNAWVECIADADRERFRQRVSALNAGERSQLDYRMRHADGSDVWVRSHLGRVRDPNDTRVFAATSDISFSRRSEALRLEAVANIAGGVAHVVNNCLTGVLGYIELHAEEHGGLDRSPLLAEAIGSTRKAAAMATQLLAFAGQQPLRPVALSLSEIGRLARPRLQSALGPATLLHMEFAPDLWACRADRDMLALAMECLAANAAEAMGGNGEFRMRARNQVGSELESGDPGRGCDWVELECADTGAGMPEHVRARAIEPFFTTRSLAEATGLGLSMVHGFVTQCGGHVQIESEPGAGTRIRLRFPRSDEHVPADPAPAMPLVLLVEDDTGIRAVTASMIRRLGYEVRETGNVHEARELCAAWHPDVLVSDIVLGQGTDGVALARELTKSSPGLAVVLVSGYARAAFDLTSLAPGYQFLGKPFSLTSLGRCLSEAARRVG